MHLNLNMYGLRGIASANIVTTDFNPLDVSKE
jgi:hypothetical protein